MKKVVKLTESQLTRVIKKVILEVEQTKINNCLSSGEYPNLQKLGSSVIYEFILKNFMGGTLPKNLHSLYGTETRPNNERVEGLYQLILPLIISRKDLEKLDLTKLKNEISNLINCIF